MTALPNDEALKMARQFVRGVAGAGEEAGRGGKAPGSRERKQPATKPKPVWIRYYEAMTADISTPHMEREQLGRLSSLRTGCTYVNCVFMFVPDGRIRICTINVPGTWHDSTMADYGVYEKMEQVFNETTGKLVVDSAFNLQAKEFLIKSSQEDPIGESEGVRINRAASSLLHLSSVLCKKYIDLCTVMNRFYV